MSEDIVVQLRGWSEGSSDDSRRMVWLMRQSADTIEALRGEVDLIKTLGVGAALETVAQKKRAQKAEAEAEALRGEVERLRSTFNAGTVEQILKVTQDRAEKAEAEAARLKAALDIAKAHAKQNQRARDLVSPYPNDHAKRIVWEKALYHEGKDLWDKLRKALGGDAS